MKRLVLFINLGTPDAPTPAAVKTYLAEFLSDPSVVKIPKLIWWPILHGLILPFRSKRSAKLYAKIWTPEGSPLLTGTKKLVERIAREKGKSECIDFAMRYGHPSIPEVIARYPHVDEILCIPLYPQYAGATTGSSQLALAHATNKKTRWIHDYHTHPLYIEALARSIERHWQAHGRAQKLLMSYHGIPQREVDQGDPYFQQCQETSRLLAKRLGLADQDFLAVFQSRFGKATWVQPYCVETLQQLPQEGIKKIDILCPGFPIDCLETLEEINLRNREIFLAAGGEDFRYIPCLNDHEDQVHLFLGLLSLCADSVA